MNKLLQYQFGPFRLDGTDRLLLRDGEAVPLTPKAFETLLVLVERSGHVVGKGELIDAVWPDVFVEEGSLTRNISVLRKALGEAEDCRAYIETIPKRGYRFVADVRDMPPDLDEMVLERRTVSHLVAEEESVEDGDARPRPGKPSALARRTGIVFAGAVALALVAGIGGWRERRPGASAAAPIQSLAVLPLDNFSGDPAEDDFADAMTDMLTTELAQIGALRVVSRTSAMQYKGVRKALPEIARELGVDAIIEGSVVRSGGRVRVTAQLIRAATDEHMWAQGYERDVGDVVALEDEVARAIAADVRVTLMPQGQATLASARP